MMLIQRFWLAQKHKTKGETDGITESVPWVNLFVPRHLYIPLTFSMHE